MDQMCDRRSSLLSQGGMYVYISVVEDVLVSFMTMLSGGDNVD